MEHLGFFQTFNTLLPLYDRDIFEQYYTQQYTTKPPPGSAWYASINVVLAIGGLISEVHSQVEGRGPGKDSLFQAEFPNNTQYSKYFHNAASCFIDLTFKEPSLMAVQALCGMVCNLPLRSFEVLIKGITGFPTTNELGTTPILRSHSIGGTHGLCNWSPSKARRIWPQ